MNPAMPLTIKPPQLPSSDFNPQIANTQHITPYPAYTNIEPARPRDRSPRAPEFSPITPKPESALPAVTVQSSKQPHPTVDSTTQPARQNVEGHTAAVAPAHFVPAPAPKPFSSDESIDALALKAAISSLQFQKQKAREDIQSLEHIKKLALADPERFTKELVAGRVKEKRHDFGSAQDVLDAQAKEQEPGSSEGLMDAMDEDVPKADKTAQSDGDMLLLPGPQNVVRMPHINWDKYNVMGEPLEALHEQQRRYPGSAPFQQNKGREFSVAAPYSPFHDLVGGQPGHARKTSDGPPQIGNPPSSIAGTPVTSEHPYETRRQSSKHQPQ